MTRLQITVGVGAFLVACSAASASASRARWHPASASAYKSVKAVRLPTSSPVYKYIKAAYDYEQYGYDTFDVNKAMRYLAPEWTFRNVKDPWSMPRRDIVGDLYESFKIVNVWHHTEKRTVKIVRFQQSGDTATVLIYARLDVLDNDGTLIPDPDIHYWCGVTGYYQDTWERVGNGWLTHGTLFLTGPE
jgi:hypothetical protein